MRTIKELLELILKGFEDKDMPTSCKPSICVFISSMNLFHLPIGGYEISADEYNLVLKYIFGNMPKKKYYYTYANFKCVPGAHRYWYPRYKIKPRINWLNKHIKLLENSNDEK